MTTTEAPPSGPGERADRRARERSRRSARRHHVTVLGVIGDILITAGVLVLLFIGWQQWFNDLVVAREHAAAAAKVSESFGKVTTPTAAPTSGWGDPVVTAQPGDTETFGVMYVPRFGADYAVPMAGGTTTAGTLDTIGIGHYDDTQMPGEVGNFAVAGHRTTHGAPFNQIANLQVGDKIYLETQDGFYTYTFRNLEYVPATQVSVLDPSPDDPGATTTDRIMTMTSCNPLYSARERIVAFSTFDSWRPRSAGAPAAIASQVKE